MVYNNNSNKNPFSVFKFYKIVPYLKLEFLITKYLSLKKAKQKKKRKMEKKTIIIVSSYVFSPHFCVEYTFLMLLKLFKVTAVLYIALAEIRMKWFKSVKYLKLC